MEEPKEEDEENIEEPKEEEDEGSTNFLGALMSPRQIDNLAKSLQTSSVNHQKEEDEDDEYLYEPSNFKFNPSSCSTLPKERRRVTIADELPTLKTSMDGKYYRRSRYSTFIAGINQFDPYQELTSTQIAAFRQVFDMVDHDGGGSIDAEELYTSMKDLESGLRLDEIKEILDELDRDGNGEIDFEEFLYMMTSMSLQIKEAQEDSSALFKQGKRRQSIFFSVITKFAMKHSLKEIERYYASKAKRSPHVVGHYAAGTRVFGLTDKELRKTWKALSHASKGKDSPYAQPLNFIVDYDNAKCNKWKKAISPLRRSKSKTPTLPTPSPSPPPNPPRKFTFTTKRVSNANDIPEGITDTSADGNSDSSTGCDVNSGNGSRKHDDYHGHDGRISAGSARSASASYPLDRSDGWTPRHRLPMTKVKLPKFTYSQQKKLTIKDMDKIRQRVNDARKIYYNDLSEEQSNKAKEYWKSLKTEQIPSERLQSNFKKVFRCYSPTNDRELRTPSPTSRSTSPTSVDTEFYQDGEFPEFVF